MTLSHLFSSYSHLKFVHVTVYHWSKISDSMKNSNQRVPFRVSLGVNRRYLQTELTSILKKVAMHTIKQ